MMTGCGEVESTPEAPATPPASSAPSAPAPTAPQADLGNDGLNIRYLDEDGKIKTLRVEDFPR